jgi:hypothetical protein
MSKIYVAAGENLTMGNGIGMLAFRTAADLATAAGMIAIRRIEISQSGSTTAAQIRGALSTRDTAGTYTMTSITPKAISPIGGPISGLVGNTAPVGGAGRIGVASSADSGGAYVDHYYFSFNNLNGWLWVPTPEERIEVPHATVWVCRLLAAPGTTTGWNISVTYEELV